MNNISPMMNSKKYICMVDAVAKFHCFLHIEGWFFCEGDELTDILIDQKIYDFIRKDIGHDHGGVLKKIGPKLGFKIDLTVSNFPLDYFSIQIIFVTLSGKHFPITLGELVQDRLTCSPSKAILNNFIMEIDTIFKSGYIPKILDIGGRDRSGIDRSKLFPNCEVIVLDIMSGANVDVVGDAHNISKYFPENYFDAVFSVSVFEHLLMPWKVSLEINKVLKNNGIGFIFTHQSLGMHDIPWDFYRFSDTAWDGLFNKFSGFKILDRSLDLTQYIIPFLIRPDKIDAEKSAGFEGSTVLFKKIGSTNLNWDVEMSDITQTSYPSNIGSDN